MMGLTDPNRKDTNRLYQFFFKQRVRCQVPVVAVSVNLQEI